MKKKRNNLIGKGKENKYFSKFTQHRLILRSLKIILSNTSNIIISNDLFIYLL